VLVGIVTTMCRMAAQLRIRRRREKWFRRRRERVTIP
jgi:hypothetical protein